MESFKLLLNKMKDLIAVIAGDEVLFANLELKRAA